MVLRSDYRGHVIYHGHDKYHGHGRSLSVSRSGRPLSGSPGVEPLGNGRNREPMADGRNSTFDNTLISNKNLAYSALDGRNSPSPRCDGRGGRPNFAHLTSENGIS